MISIVKGDIFNSDCEALVNPVNCVGVMSKGLAKQFRDKFPENYKKYYICCMDKTLVIGKCLTVYENNKRIINLPTKVHWRNPSKYEYVEAGLESLIKHIKHFKINSIAIPALGCGEGGLEFSMVRDMIFDKFSKLDIRIKLYII